MNYARHLSLSLLCLATACGGQSAEYEQAKALQAAILAAQQAHGPTATEDLDEALGMLATKAPKGRSPDAVDVMGLATEAEVMAILKQRGAAGDATATGSFRVTKQKVAGYGAQGYGTSMCRYEWTAHDAEGQLCAQGNFQLTVFDLETFTWLAAGDKKRLPDLGDEAVDDHGVTYVRVGDLAMQVVNNTATEALARMVLAAAAPRLR